MKEERKDAIKKPALLLGLSFIAIGCTLGLSSFSWFSAPQTSASLSGITGEATGSYFEDGDGSESDPYLIVSAKQLYYFAWLQDMGYFNEADSTTGEIPTTYFKLGKDIDASGYVLPPCGIEKYPFLGNFDGNNHTVSNLTIANRIEDNYIKTYPEMLKNDNSRLKKDEFNDSQGAIVGFFGIIGQYNSIPSATYSSSTNEVKNLYLDELTIKTNKNNLLVGIFAGYANGVIDNCGVHYAEMDIDGATSKITDFDKVSEYTLVGSYNKTKFSWETTSGGGSGGDAGYGTSTNIRGLHTFLTKFSLTTDGSDGVIKAGTAIPFQPDSSASITEKSGTITVGGRTVTNASTIATNSSSTNIGYYVGGTVASNIDTTASMRIFKDHYTSSVLDFENIQIPKLNDTTYYSDVTIVPDRVKTYLETAVSGDVLQGYSVLRMGTPNTLTETMTKDSGYYGIESGKVGSYSGNILVPNNCIWVAPQKAGTFEFVCVNENAKTSYIRIWKLKRSSPKDYSSSLSTPDDSKQAINFSSDSEAEVVGFSVPYASSPYKAYYYGTSISETDINNGVEFAITLYGYQFMNGSLYIVYMDIGSDSGGSSGTTPDRTFNAPFDFVTKENGVLTKIKNADGTEIEGNTYTKSNVFFEIGDADASRALYWRRTTIDNETIVLYYPSSTSSVLTPAGTGSSGEASDDKCTSKKAS